MYILKTHFGNIGIETNPRGLSKIILGPKKFSGQITPISQIKNTISQLKDYFHGKKVEFKVSYDISNLPIFTQKVLRETMKIPYGCTVSYSELAQKIGNPKAMRAVGQSLANNPLPIIIPCHRVVSKDGSLAGFSAGIKWKRILLKIESRSKIDNK